ncbi:MAG TPA: hypothetical protein VJ890_21105 [Vineibacter sp.]|nr:hypothetical protein [Vineibacter sp.]
MTPLYSTIVTPAAERNLVTLDDLREQLRVRPGDTANDAWYTKVIARSSLAAERYCNRIFAKQGYSDVFRGGTSGMGDEPLVLSMAPVDPLTLEVTLDGAVMAADGYALQPLPSHLWRVGSSTAWSNSTGLTVAYTAGFDPIPADVQQAVLDLCTMENAGRGRDPMLRATESPGLGRQEYWVGGVPGSSLLPQDIASLLNPYRRGMVG